MTFFLLNCKTRAIANYLLVLFLWFSDYLEFLSSILIICNKVLAFIILSLSLTTNFKYGIIKLFSIRTYGKIERTIAVLLLFLPLLFFSILEIYDITFCIGFGAILIILNIITDFCTYKYRYTLI